MTNIAKWEEGTEITLDSEVEAASAGWVLNYASVLRIGSAVAVHIEATSDGTGTGHICTLPPQFAPGALVTTSDGLFTIAQDGTVTRLAGGAAGVGRINVNYAAGEASP
jgi:hypothetical protein